MKTTDKFQKVYIIQIIKLQNDSKKQMQTNTPQHMNSPIFGSFDLLFIVRLIFYIMVALKLFEVVYLRKRKMNLKERIYRKFLFAHNEVIRGFSDDQKLAMENTLSNTLKNANMTVPKIQQRKSKTSKRVCFSTDSNDYYQPRREQQQPGKTTLANGDSVQDSDFVNQQPQSQNLLQTDNQQQN